MSKTLYTITSDMEAVFNLLQNAIDEDGNQRELTQEECDVIQEWFKCTKEEFQTKVDSYCKFIKNCKIHAENINNERNTYKAELDRLSARAKVHSNTAERLQGMLRFSMESLGLDKAKTELFTLTIQNTAMSVKAREGSDLGEVPEKYLKPRELDTQKIREDIKNGVLVVSERPDETYGHVYDTDGNILKGVFAARSQTLVIR